MQLQIAIVGYPPFSKLARESTIELPPWVNFQITELPLNFLTSRESIEELQTFFDPATIIISGDRSANYLKQTISNLVIPVKMTGFDLLEKIQKVSADEVIMMNLNEELHELSELYPLINKKIKQIQFKNIQEAYNILEHLRSEGVKDIFGGSWVCDTANKLGMNGIFYYTNKAMDNAIQDALNILQTYRNDLESMNLFQTMMNMNRSGVIYTDSAANIKVMNQVAGRLLGVSIHKSSGKELSSIFPSIKKATYKNWTEPQYNLLIEHDQKKLIVDIVPVDFQGERMGHLISLDDVVRVQEKERKIRKNITHKPMIAHYSFEDIIGESATIKETKEQALKYSKADASVLIYGESGTGKELFAQSIHRTSHRSLAPFVAVNCAALPETLIDSELFGYEEGSFTGAKKGGKIGKFELAHQGTIFLDEISELPLHLQSRLLRVLQEKEVVRIGGDQVIPIDVRIIAASNKNLLDCIKNGDFREDLYYRISVLQLHISPLHKRQQDILLLFKHFIQKNERLSQFIPKIDLTPLLSYRWHGNVRELENVAERFMVLCQGEFLTVEIIQEILNQALYNTPDSSIEHENLEDHLDSMINEENERIQYALKKFGGNKEKAAEMLGMSRTTLWRKLKKEQVTL